MRKKTNKGAETTLKEIIPEIQKINLPIQEAQQTPGRRSTKRSTVDNTAEILKAKDKVEMLKDKDKMRKSGDPPKA